MNTEQTNQSRQAANAAFEQWWQRHGLEDPMDDEDRYYITASSWARRGYLAAMGLATIKDSLTVAQQAALIENLKVLAKGFGHKTGCAKNAFGEQCTCGVDDAIAAAEQAQQAEPVGHFTGEFAGCGDILEFVVRAHGPLPPAGAKLYAQQPVQQQDEPLAVDPAVAAIQFALETHSDGLHFLRLWNEGEFDLLRREWPEAPEDVYIGADPLLEAPAQPPAQQQSEPRCACGDSFTSDAVCANCLAAQQQAEPVARDVLMAFGKEVKKACGKAWGNADDGKEYAAIRDCDISAIVDRHATQPPAVAVPDGYALVPVEPTDEMCEAAWESEGTDYVGEHRRIFRFDLAYKAAVSAAQKGGA